MAKRSDRCDDRVADLIDENLSLRDELSIFRIRKNLARDLLEDACKAIAVVETALGSEAISGSDNRQSAINILKATQLGLHSADSFLAE
jgi:hypothetical protein